MSKITQIINSLRFVKQNKKISILVFAGLLMIVLIFLSELDFSSTDDDSKQISEYNNVEYCTYLENKVTEIIEAIDGAGKTKVMITLSETTEYIYATDDKDSRKQTDSTNDANIQNDYVIIEKDNNDSGLLIKTIEPKIRGIAVVCEGGDNISVQNQIYSVVSAVLNINTSRISIAKLSLLEEIKWKAE